ncbi:sensor histidine kinase [Conexibacter woesei]|nr:sensor histidine kinase [Conexibacter woesei]
MSRIRALADRMTEVRAAPRAVDAAWAAGVASACLLLLALHIDSTGPSELLAVALTVGACAPLALRRTLPALAAIASLALGIALALLGYGGAAYVVALLLVVHAAIVSDREQAVVLGLLTSAATMALAIRESDDQVLLAAFAGGVAGIVPALFGDAIRNERGRAQAAHELARRVEERRDRDVERAVTEERLRIARDVHDVTGHHLSAISLQAAGASRTTEDPIARAALARIHEATAAALGQTRHALGILKQTGPAELSPPPRLEHVERLLEPAREAGLTVDVEVRGERRALPDAVELCAYRVLQEALTNVVRHARASRVVVTTAYLPRNLVVSVEDDGIGSDTDGGAPEPPAGGHGIPGMRERAALAGGRLEVGPTAPHGWRVRADLPLGEVA